MVKLVFIAESINDLAKIKECVLSDVLFITYNPVRDKIAKLEQFLDNPIIADNRITNVSWIFHSPSENLCENVQLFADVKLDSRARSAAKVVRFFKKIEAIIDSDAPRFDLMACCLLKNPQFAHIKKYMQKKMSSSKMQIAASDDLTGSAYYGPEQNWVLESHNVNLVGLYFSEEINKYKFTFKGNPIENIRNNIADATFAAVDGDWQGALNSMGSAILMAPIRLPIVEGCSKIYEALKDPAVQTIFDAIPGLNLVSFTVRMGQFIDKAARGEASDWDIAFAVLDSVSLVAGFAVPGGNMSSNVVRSGVRSAGNIAKVKNLARSSCSVLQYSKDIGEMVQAIAENPNEKCIDDVAIQAAKIACSAKLGKADMSEKLKAAAQAGSAGGFYAIKEISARAEREYDRIQAEQKNKPRAVLYAGDFAGAQSELIQGTAPTNLSFTNCNSIRIPPRTAIRIWSDKNYNGTVQDFCNWNWFEMRISAGQINNKYVGSAICVPIQQDGSFAWIV